jgi:hypothetical protein
MSLLLSIVPLWGVVMFAYFGAHSKGYSRQFARSFPGNPYPSNPAEKEKRARRIRLLRRADA